MDKFNNYNLDEDEIEVIQTTPSGFLNNITRKVNVVQQEHLRERGYWKYEVRRLERTINHLGGDLTVTKMYLVGAFLAFFVPFFIGFDTIFHLRSWGLNYFLNPTIVLFYYVELVQLSFFSRQIYRIYKFLGVKTIKKKENLLNF